MIEAREYQQRIRELQKRIHAAGIDAFVLRTDGNIRYFSGVTYFSMERKILLVVPAKGEPTLIAPLMEQERLRTSPSVNEILSYWEMDALPGRDWQTLLHRSLETARTVAIEPLAEVELTLALQDYQWQVSTLVEDMRVIKSAAEVEAIRGAAHYASDMVNTMLDQARAGVPVAKLAAAGGSVLETMFQREAGINHYDSSLRSVFEISPDSGSPHNTHARRHPPLPDGSAIINAFCVLRNYNAENERMVLLGDYTSQHQELFDTVQRAQQLALDTIKPGVPSAEVEQRVQQFFQQEGMSDYVRHRTGHGFGLFLHERPYTSEASEETYQPNMVISVEPALYVKGVGGFRHSDTVLITETGNEVLTAGTPKDRASLTF